jgi:hypothetical protein
MDLMSGPLESVVVRPYFINEKVYRLNSKRLCMFAFELVGGT